MSRFANVLFHLSTYLFFYQRCLLGFTLIVEVLPLPIANLVVCHTTQCLKIAQKVALNLASEASYIYILSGQKFIKNAKNDIFWRFFDNLKLAVKQ